MQSPGPYASRRIATAAPLRLIAASRLRQDAAMLSLNDIAAMAATTARTHGAEVMGVARTGHDSAYAEVILAVPSGPDESSRAVVAVNRDSSEHDVRDRVHDTLRTYALRQAGDRP